MERVCAREWEWEGVRECRAKEEEREEGVSEIYKGRGEERESEACV